VEVTHGFFASRRPIPIRPIVSSGRRQKALINYVNVPASIARVLSSGMASLHELDTVHGCTDLYMMMEVIAVDDYNQALMNSD
jgi:hypothetical protein